MNVIQTILELSRLYGEAEGVSPTTVSWRAFNDSKRIRALHDGKTITIRRAETVIAWFSDNWPEEAVWPADVARPETTRSAA